MTRLLVILGMLAAPAGVAEPDARQEWEIQVELRLQRVEACQRDVSRCPGYGLFRNDKSFHL